MTDLRRWVTWELLTNLATYEMMGANWSARSENARRRQQSNTAKYFGLAAIGERGGVLAIVTTLTEILERFLKMMGWTSDAQGGNQKVGGSGEKWGP